MKHKHALTNDVKLLHLRMARFMQNTPKFFSWNTISMRKLSYETLFYCVENCRLQLANRVWSTELRVQVQSFIDLLFVQLTNTHRNLSTFTQQIMLNLTFATTNIELLERRCCNQLMSSHREH